MPQGFDPNNPNNPQAQPGQPGAATQPGAPQQPGVAQPGMPKPGFAQAPGLPQQPGVAPAGVPKPGLAQAPGLPQQGVPKQGDPQQPGVAQQQPPSPVAQEPAQQQPGQVGLPAAPGALPSLGFQAPPKQEKYNTQYLTSHLTHDRRNVQLLILGAIVAAIAGIIFWTAMVPKSDKPAPGAKPPSPAAATATVETKADHAKKADDANKGEAKDTKADDAKKDGGKK